MPESTFTFPGPENNSIFVYRWASEMKTSLIGAVQIVHGLAEHAGRYDVLAKFLNQSGYIVYANDHRGHGKSAGSPDKVGIAYKKNGHIQMVEDMYYLNQIIKKENPGLPVYLLGHSMGSFFTQVYAGLYGNGINGAILSSSTGPLGFTVDIGIFLSWLLGRIKGRDTKDKVVNNVCLGTYNTLFKTPMREFDWLSQDVPETGIAESDPYCKGVYSAGFFYDLFKVMKKMNSPEIMKKIPAGLPIFIFSGANDPISNSAKTVRNLYSIYKRLGVKDVEMKIYPGARHLTLYGTGQGTVLEDIVDWLKRH